MVKPIRVCHIACIDAHWHCTGACVHVYVHVRLFNALGFWSLFYAQTQYLLNPSNVVSESVSCLDLKVRRVLCILADGTHKSY